MAEICSIKNRYTKLPLSSFNIRKGELIIVNYVVDFIACLKLLKNY